MKRVLAIVVVAILAAGAGLAADRGAPPPPPPPGGRQVPYRVIPMENVAAVVKNWSDENAPHYAIIGNLGEWRATFTPTVVMGDKRPTEPDPGLFNREVLVAISRVSDAPAPGERVLAVKSVARENGELVLTYSFMPPPRRGGHRAKSTLVVAIPAEFQDGLRLVEEIETPTTIATQRELDAAKAAGRVKPPALPPAPPPGPPAPPPPRR